MTNQISQAELSEYDFYLLTDRSGSMGASDGTGGQTRWAEAANIAKSVAEFAGQVDDDGIDVGFFGGQFNASNDLHKNVTAAAAIELFNKQGPGGTTPLAEALEAVLNMHFSKTTGKKSFITVVTDGVPNNPQRVAELIIDAANRINQDSDLSIQFLQVGRDADAERYLTSLDDDLQKRGAKYDIVDKKTVAERGNMTFEELFWQAQND